MRDLMCVLAAAAAAGSTGALAATPQNTGVPVQVVRYLNMDASGWQRTASKYDYSDLYTRIILGSNDTQDVPAGYAYGKRDYRAEDRGWVARVFSGKTDTVTGILNVTVTDPNLTPSLTLAIPLFSFSHASGLKLGNSWDTVYTASDIESPLFRIGTDTTVSIQASAKVSSDVKSQGTSLAIGALTTAIKTAAPTAKVLTTLTNTQTNNTATAIDTAISSLLSRDVAELVKSDRQISTWEPGRLIEFDGCSPFIHETVRASVQGFCAENIDLEGVGDTLVGRWAVSIACPRLSIFSEKDVCTTAAPDPRDPTKPHFKIIPDIFDSDGRIRMSAEASLADQIRDDDVLTFHLTNQTTIEAFVLAQQWFTSFAAKSKPDAIDFATFCSDAPLALRNSGLNSFDAHLVLRAMILELPELAKFRSEFGTGKHGDACVSELSRTGVSLD